MDYENWRPPKGQLEIVKLPDGTARIMRCINGIIVENNQPERLNPEDASDSVCDSLNSVETQRGRSEEVSPPVKMLDS